MDTRPNSSRSRSPFLASLLWACAAILLAGSIWLAWDLGRSAGSEEEEVLGQVTTRDGSPDTPAIRAWHPGSGLTESTNPLSPESGEAQGGETVLRLPDSMPPDEKAALLEELRRRGAKVTGTIPSLNAYRLSLPPGMTPESLADLAPGSEAISNTVLSLPRAVDLPSSIEEGASLTGTPWFGRDYLEAIGLQPAEGKVRPVTVAVIDSGIDTSVEGLFERTTVQRMGEGGRGDEVGHGTAMAAVIAGELDGAAPGVTLLDYPVLQGEEGVGTAFDVAEAILDATEQGADVINVSLGAYVDDPLLRAAIEAADRAGVTVVAASGNDGLGQVAYPAAYPGALGIGAAERTGMRADFSNGGEGLDLLAPGAGLQVRTDEANAIELSGTSGAAAVTTGAIAALMQADPSLSAAEAADLLIEFADDGGAAGPDAEYGAGTVNVTRVNERRSSGVEDVALGGVTVDGELGEFALTIENRGTEQITGASVEVKAGQNYDFELLVPPLLANESTSLQVPLSANQVRQLAGGEFEAAVRLSTGEDVRPENDRVNVRLPAAAEGER